MRFTSLSDNPNSPCSVLQFKQATIMLGTVLTSLNGLVTELYTCHSKRDAASSSHMRIQILRRMQCCGSGSLWCRSGYLFSLCCGSDFSIRCGSGYCSLLKICESSTTGLKTLYESTDGPLFAYADLTCHFDVVNDTPFSLWCGSGPNILKGLMEAVHRFGQGFSINISYPRLQIWSVLIPEKIG